MEFHAVSNLIPPGIALKEEASEAAPQTRRDINPSRPRSRPRPRFVLSVEDEDEDEDEDENLNCLQRILIFKDSTTAFYATVSRGGVAAAGSRVFGTSESRGENAIKRCARTK